MAKVTQVRSSKLALARDAAKKLLKDDNWLVTLDPNQLREPLPHLPTGSLVIDYLIGGEENFFGVAPCPGLPRGRITQLWGHESAGKCLSSDTLVLTSDSGYRTIADIFASEGVSIDTVVPDGQDVSFERRVPLINRYGQVEYTKNFTCNGVRDVYEITTASGAKIRNTANHPHLTMDESGNWTFVETSNLTVGSYMIRHRGDLDTSQPIEADLESYVIGAMVADAWYGEEMVSLTNDDPDVLSAVSMMGPSLLGGIPSVHLIKGKNSTKLGFGRKKAVRSFYDRLGITPGVAKTKVVPARFLSTDNTSEIVGFLQGYFDCEMSIEVDKCNLEVSSASRDLLAQVQLMLSRLGITGRIAPKKVKNYPDNEYWRLSVSGEDGRKYAQIVGTRSAVRRPLVDAVRTFESNGSTNHDSVPNVSHLIRTMYKTKTRNRAMHHLCADYMTGRARLTNDRLSKILAAFPDEQGVEIDRLREIHAKSSLYYYDPIVSIKAVGQEPTFDFEMESTASFIANGFVTHNTTLALTAAAETCRNGGCVLYVDWENDIVPDYAAALGVPIDDPDKFLLAQPESLEEGMKLIKLFVQAGVDLVVIDSVGAAVPQAIKDRDIKDVGEQSRIGLNAQRWSEFLPDLKGEAQKTGTVILGISQVRQKMSTGPGNYGPSTAPQGGEAWKFYSALRLELRRITNEKSNIHNTLTSKKEERVIGGVIKAKVVKCKLSSSQGREEVFYIRWGEGIDDLRSVIEIAAAHGIIKKQGAWFQFGEKRMQGIEQVRAYFRSNAEAFAELAGKVRPHLTRKSSEPVDEEDDDDELDLSAPASGEEIDLGLD